MNLRTLTWNIGGGKLLKNGKDPNVMASYTVDGVDDIAQQIKATKADIIAIQEAHGDENNNQIAKIAKKLGYEYHVYDATSDSHIDSAYKLGNGLISRFPISDVQTGRFLNPEVSFEIEGRKTFTHDKGYVSCLIHVGDAIIHATSLHLIPFRSVGLEFDSESALQILSSVSASLTSQPVSEYRIVQGDFNIHSDTVKDYLEDLFASDSLSEVTPNKPTTPKGRKYDHVLFRGVKLAHSTVDSAVKTDHFPVISDFVIEK